MADTYKTKADYTILRKRHQNASNGDIFENDYMTISPMDTIFSEDQDIISSDSNFKFSYRINNNLQKKHAKSGWIKTPEGSEEWTIDDAISGGSVSDESKIRIKPNYNSLKDFAYYGSAVELVRGSLNDIIQNFPAELYFSEKTLKSELEKVNDNVTVPDTWKLISNDFGINAHVDNINASNVYNPLRYLSLSIDSYNLIKGDKITPLTGITITTSNATCDDDLNGKTIATAETSGIKIYTYLMGGKTYLYYKESFNEGLRIRPNDDVVEEYFATIDEFEYVLLNRDSKPLYMSNFDTPYETDKGNFYKKETYIWPSKYNWNPDIESIGYENYVERLISLAEFHDEYDSNNIWRSMTHEAIKNLDWTFVRENGDDIEDLSKIDSSKIEIFLQLYGRQFDGLKRYIDTIKYSNQVSYNEKNNLPDYCLTDSVGNSGWDVKPLIATGKSEFYSDILYNNMSKGYSEVEANNNFMRNLKLNSRYILSNKGTREGIAALLGLLGIYKDEYEINEHVAIAKGNPEGYCHFVSGLTNMIYPNAEDIEFVNMKKDSLLDDYAGDVYEGIGVKEVTSKEGRYVVPWYVNGKKYDNGMYFQCDGGWGKIKGGIVDGNIVGFYPLEINVDCTPITAFTPTQIDIYEETQNYLKFASDLNEMLDFTNSVVKEGMIVYVTDIENADSYGFTGNDLSHYFILKDKDKSTTANGWSAVKQTDLDNASALDNESKKDVERIIYLESIRESTEGNNSHTGEGNYDDGKSYVNKLNSIFGGAIENNDFTRFTQADIKSAITKYTFNIETGYKDNKTGYKDNKKCWYFGKGSKNGDIINEYQKSQTEYDYFKLVSGITQTNDKEAYWYTKIKQNEIPQGTEIVEKDEEPTYGVNSGSTKYIKVKKWILVQRETNGDLWDTPSSYTPVNPEGGNTYEEPAANSIVNLKNIDIIFYYPFDEESKKTLPYFQTRTGRLEFKKYLLNVVMPYLEQVIPSTTIMTYDIMEKSGGTPSPSVADVTSMDNIPTPEGYTVLDIDGVIYTNEDYVNGMDMIDDDNIINR